jgi:RNA polymerase sigma factor (sigma-70 family)
MDDPTHSTAADEALLERFARDGDREAAAELARRYQTPVYDLALRIARDANDAADATQATFLAVLRGARGFGGRSSFKTWLYRIAIRAALRVQTQRKKTQRSEDAVDANELAEPQRNEGRRRAIEALEREVGGLPEHERLAVVLHYFRGLSYDEAAEALGCASGTVGSRLASARDRLKARFGSLGLAAAAPDLESLLRAASPAAPPAALRAEIAKIASATVPAAAGKLMSASAAWLVAGGLAAAAVTATVVLTQDRGAAEARSLASASRRAGAPAGDPAGNPMGDARQRPGSAPSRVAVSAPDPKNPNPNETNAGIRFRAMGRVVDAKSGLPVEGARVVLERLWPPDPTIRQMKGIPGPAARTDASGRYALENTSPRAAVYRLQIDWFGPLVPMPDSEESAPAAGAASAPSAAPRNPNDPPPAPSVKAKDLNGWTPVEIVEATESREATVDFTVESKTSNEIVARSAPARAALVRAYRNALAREKLPSVFGSVQREDGSPVPQDTFLRVFENDGSQDSALALLAFDHATGDFCAGPLPEGNARVEAVATTGGYAVASGIPVGPPGPTEGIVLTLRRGEASLTGIVVNPKGEPLAGSLVEAFPAALTDGGFWIPPAATARTAKDGSFALEKVGNPGEPLRIFIHAEGYRLEKSADRSAGDRGVRFVVKPNARVRGKVVVKGTGLPPKQTFDPFALLSIEVNPKNPKSMRIKGPVQTMMPHVDLGADGSFSTVAEPGPADVTIEMNGYATVTIPTIVGEDGVDLGTIELVSTREK